MRSPSLSPQRVDVAMNWLRHSKYTLNFIVTLYVFSKEILNFLKFILGRYFFLQGVSFEAQSLIRIIASLFSYNSTSLVFNSITMRYTTLHLIKITVAFVLLLQTGKLNAQSYITWATYLSGSQNRSGTFTGGTVTVASSGPGYILNIRPSDEIFTASGNDNRINLNVSNASQVLGIQGSWFTPPSQSLRFTFSKPVIINELNIAEITKGNDWNNSVSFSGVAFSSVTGAQCFFTTTGATAQFLTTNNSSYARWTTSTTAVTSFTINYNSSPYTHKNTYYSLKVSPECAAGYIAPTLSTNTRTNVCPGLTINLDSLVTSAIPSGVDVGLRWFSNNTATGTALTNTSAVTTAGTYYAFYYDTTNNCYSPASAAVQAAFTPCPININNICPSSSVDLSYALDSSSVVPSGYIQTFHSGTPPSSANRLPSSVVTTPGNYYNYLYSSSLNSYTGTSLRPLAVTIKDCCVSDN